MRKTELPTTRTGVFIFELDAGFSVLDGSLGWGREGQRERRGCGCSVASAKERGCKILATE